VIQIRMKDLFFDSAAVSGALSKERRRALSQAGAFIRKSARDSMRRSNSPAPPGQPPRRHENPLLYRRLFFAYDPSTRSVVVGSEGFAGSGAPGTLEHGGTVTIPRRRRGGRTVPATSSSVEPRPYMGPALAKELPRLPEPWANSVSGGGV
jgi:hypothetical protein